MFKLTTNVMIIFGFLLKQQNHIIHFNNLLQNYMWIFNT